MAADAATSLFQLRGVTLVS